MHKTTNLTLQFLNLWLTLLLIWVIANGTLAVDTLITGVVVCAAIALAFASFARVYSVIRWSPKVIFYYLMYFAVFLVELTKANLNVMRLVFSPRIAIEPGIYRYSLVVGGETWTLPPGVISEPDGVGGQVGLLIVR